MERRDKLRPKYDKSNLLKTSEIKVNLVDEDSQLIHFQTKLSLPLPYFQLKFEVLRFRSELIRDSIPQWQEFTKR